MNNTAESIQEGVNVPRCWPGVGPVMPATPGRVNKVGGDASLLTPIHCDCLLMDWSPYDAPPTRPAPRRHRKSASPPRVRPTRAPYAPRQPLCIPWVPGHPKIWEVVGLGRFRFLDIAVGLNNCNRTLIGQSSNARSP